MNMRSIDVKVNTFGKAPTRYGRNAYKIGKTEWALFVRAGWTHAGDGKEYSYVIPPAGVGGCNPTITVQVPTDEEILSLALEMHHAGKTAVQVIEGFIVFYHPKDIKMYQIIDTIVFGPGHRGERQGPQPPVLHKAAEFTFGVSAPWSIKLIWDHGNDQPPIWTRSEKNIVPIPSDIVMDKGLQPVNPSHEKVASSRSIPKEHEDLND